MIVNSIHPRAVQIGLPASDEFRIDPCIEKAGIFDMADVADPLFLIV